VKRIAIIGGGLAGCAAAYELLRRGHVPVIYEAGDALASGASGNALGLYNPRFGAEWSPQSQYYAAAFEKAIKVFQGFDDVDFNPCGALHLMNDERKVRRFSKMIDAWVCGIEMRTVDAAEASRIAGIGIEYDCLYLPQAGRVSPAKLCAVYAEGVEVVLNYDGGAVDADVTILTAGAALRGFDGLEYLDLRAVRGQVTHIKEVASLKANICYGGYVSAAVDGVHMVGASFQRWLDHDDILPEDNDDNLSKLYDAVPDFPRGVEVVGEWAGVRCAARDHFPVVGQLYSDTYISTAHGSHGVLSSLMAAEIIANQIENKPQRLSADVLAALSPQRFKD